MLIHKVFVNKLLNRRQLAFTIIHLAKSTPSRDSITQQISKKFKADARNIIVFNIHTQFGGNRSQGNALIYDNAQSFIKHTPRNILERRGIAMHRGHLKNGRIYLSQPWRKSNKTAKQIEIKKRQDRVLQYRQEKKNYLASFQ